MSAGANTTGREVVVVEEVVETPKQARERRERAEELDSQARCEELGLVKMVQMIEQGVPHRLIAQAVGVPVSSLWNWMNSSPERRQACARARQRAAQSMDEMAEKVVLEARDPFELAKAKELAIHYRWRAKVMNPKGYGDKVDVEVRHMTLADALRKLDSLPPAEGSEGAG
ncbi:hypothetical protein UFOVP707_28 [uncultured Caudovirales phage]|uniref:Uncharacterized protein n=1 Tax=uncultured Caudovirales phage TaxID=2100421 RepID=A0A6J5NHR9_9CAUD|nr:hypothetical protein UFOVP707_28 [uncultured Caudovirales phage]